MIRLSAFADEIAQDPTEQVRVLLEENIRWIDLRSAWGTNILDLSNEQVASLGEIFQRAGIGVAAIASPIGKTLIDEPMGAVIARLDRAIGLAHTFRTRSIRLFSFYGPAGGTGDWQAGYRDEVLTRMRNLARRAEAAEMLLLHENEREIYGDTVARCVDLLESINSPNLKAAFDPANYVQCGETPIPDAFEALLPWIEYVHVKDATADGTVVPAGQGVTRFPEFLARLRAAGYEGDLALEPHLSSGGRFSGFSGPDLFREASDALKRLLRELGWEHE